MAHTSVKRFSIGHFALMCVHYIGMGRTWELHMDYHLGWGSKMALLAINNCPNLLKQSLVTVSLPLANDFMEGKKDPQQANPLNSEL